MLGRRREGGKSVTATGVRWFFLAVGVSAVVVLVFLVASVALDGGGS
jgi:hypothetical protein